MDDEKRMEIIKDSLKKEYLIEIVKELVTEWGIGEENLLVDDKGELQIFRSAVTYIDSHLVPVMRDLITRLATAKAELWFQTKLTKKE